MELEETEEWKKYKEELKEKEKSLLQGDDVVHLTYLSSLVNEHALNELRTELKGVNLRLSSWDDSGVIKASFEDYSLQLFLALNNPVTLEILKTIGLNTTWETIKYSTLKLYKSIKNSRIELLQNRKKTIKKVNFGFKLKVDKKISFDFKLDGDLSDELVLKSMDKALDFIKEHNGHSFPIQELPVFSTFDTKEKKWKKVNVLEEMKKKRKKK